MNTNHQMNYYDYAKTLSAEGIMIQITTNINNDNENDEDDNNFVVHGTVNVLIQGTGDYNDVIKVITNIDGIGSYMYVQRMYYIDECSRNYVSDTFSITSSPSAHLTEEIDFDKTYYLDINNDNNGETYTYEVNWVEQQ